MEQGRMGKVASRGRDGAEDDREGYDNGRGGAQATGPQRTGEKRRIRGERRGDGQGESDVKSEGWSVGSEGDLDEETEEDGMPKGEQEEKPGGGAPWSGRGG